MPDDSAGLEYALALTAAYLATIGRARRLRVLTLMEQWLREDDGAARDAALEALRAHAARFIGE